MRFSPPFSRWWPVLLLLSTPLANGKASSVRGLSAGLDDQEAQDLRPAPAGGFGGSGSPEVLECRLTVLATTYSAVASSLAGSSSDPEGIGPIKTNTIAGLGCIVLDRQGQETSRILPFAGPPSRVTSAPLARVARGNWRASIHGATLTDWEVSLPDGSAVRAYQEEETGEDEQRHRRASGASGTKSVFVVRVSAPDSSPVRSLSEMLSAMFASRATSFRSQYQACSFGKLVWTSAGGMDVKLDNRISSYGGSPTLLANEAIRKVEARTGRPINSLADKIVLCQPPGSGSWIALATVNGWRVNINDTGGFCLSLSTLMHEVGHTLGLLHSGEGSDDYGDETGYMGYGYKSSTSPRKCFNGYKSFQLGWYSDRVLTVNPASGRRLKLATFVDYGHAAPDEPVVISILGKYFLQYNRAKGMNAETNEKANLVTVTDNARSKSLSAAGLGPGNRFVRSNFLGTGRTLVVVVCDRREGAGANGADLMVVSIGYGRSFC